MTKVLLLGYYGFGNFGDDLFNDALVSIFQELGRGSSVLVPCSTSSRAKAYSVIPSAMERFWRSSGTAAGAFRNLATLALIPFSDVVVFGGGSLFQSGPRLRHRERLIDLARSLGRRVVAIGVSVGPADPGRESRLAEVVRKLDRIGVRDKASMEFCWTHGIEQASFTGDLALGYVSPRPRTPRNRLGVALHGDRYRGALREKVRALAREVEEVLLLTLDRRYPEWVEQVRQDFVAEGIDTPLTLASYDGDTDAVVEAIAWCRILVTSKLHGGVTARALDVPFLLDEYEPKCTEFLRDTGWLIGMGGPEGSQQIEDRWRAEMRASAFAAARSAQLRFPFLEASA